METYLLQSSIALTIFYILYRVIIVYENNQQVKRFIGLALALFCSTFLLLPSFQFDSSDSLPFVITGAIEQANTVQSSLTYVPSNGMNPLMVIYIIGVCLFSIRFFVGLIKLTRLVFNSQVSKRWGFILVETDTPTSPFSFFNLLFIQKGDSDKIELAPIIVHEQYHRDQLHSIDAILFEILTIIFWFNPFIWLLQKDVKDSHEYLADSHVISTKGFDKLTYQNLLFEARTGISIKSVNYLSNQTSLKQRFNMMEKKKTHTRTSLLPAGIVLVAMVLVASMTSFSIIENALNDQGPDIRFYTANGEVDLKKGIPKSTDKLFVRMLPKDETPNIAFRINKTQATLVSGGLGRWSLEAKEMFDFGSNLSGAEKGSILLIEVQEYMTKDAQDVVEKTTLAEPISFKIPIN